MSQPDGRSAGAGDAPATAEPGLVDSGAPAPKVGAARRLAGVIVSPGEAFGEISRNPTWLAPILIAVLAMLAVNAFYTWRFNPDWEKTVLARIEEHMRTTGQVMTPEQVEQQLTLARVMKRFFLFVPFVHVPAACLLVAGIYFVGFGLAFLRSPSFGKILSVVAWGEAANRVVSGLVLIVVLALTSEEGLRGGGPGRTGFVIADPGAFLHAGASPVLKSLASSLNVFTVWFLALLTIGFSKVAEADSQRITVWKAGALVFGVWAAWVLTKAGMAFAFGY